MDDEEDIGPDAREADDERSSGRLTTIIPRPADRRASDAGRSRLGSRRRRSSDRIASRRSGWVFGLAALVVAGAIAAALFVLPVRTWFEQDKQIDALENELDEMRAVNDDLTGEVDRLQTDEGIIEAAREELGQIQANEHRQTMLAHPDLPRDMPDGWPYTQVDQILLAHANAVTAAAAAAAGEASTDGGGPAVGNGGAGGFQPVTGATATTGAPAAPATTTTAPPAASTSTSTSTSTTVTPTAAGG
ncbi:FtsB family cell division protein [Desertimonas flava]|uniref:FtsB family cell division protein n=1 Tax=Desertimonas flava TaxID=2064846 RepID=UPI0013C49FA1|nr:septum formation initiator family protein [Desertimonas flava]